MASKSKGKGGKPKAAKDDDDWEIILANEALANGATAAAQKKKEALETPEVAAGVPAEDGVDGSDDDEDDDAGGEPGAKKVIQITFIELPDGCIPL